MFQGWYMYWENGQRQQLFDQNLGKAQYLDKTYFSRKKKYVIYVVGVSCHVFFSFTSH